MNVEYVTGPLVGAVIGLLTNSIAIKMLFKPLRPIYLDRKHEKYRLPFTPGLIPKERGRIAAAVGRIVGTRLLDDATIKRALLTDSVHGRVMDRVHSLVDGYASLECTVNEFLQERDVLVKVDAKEAVVKEKLGSYTTKKLLEAHIGQTITNLAIDEISKKVNPMIMSMLTKTLNVEHIAQKIDSVAEEKVPAVVGTYLDREYVNLKDKPVGEVVSKLVELYPQYDEKVWELYRRVVEDKASEVIREFNVAKVVEDKVNEFDLEEMETIVLDIAKKELDALVWLGGLLGAIMGIVNAVV